MTFLGGRIALGGFESDGKGEVVMCCGGSLWLLSDFRRLFIIGRAV